MIKHEFRYVLYAHAQAYENKTDEYFQLITGLCENLHPRKYPAIRYYLQTKSISQDKLT